MSLKPSNIIFPDFSQGTLAEITALPQGATVDNINYFQVEGKYYRRVVTGIKRAVEAGIKGDGSNETAKLTTLLSQPDQDYLLDIPIPIQVQSSVNGGGKRLIFRNGCKLSGSGSISNIYVEAAPDAVIFDTTLSATILNTVIHAKWFGFSPTATAAVNTKALQNISACINTLSGGVTLIISKGIYTVGKETFAGVTGAGHAYLGEQLLALQNNANDIIIEGNGATIKLANGLHFGSFDPVTGAIANIYLSVNHTGGYTVGNSITMTVQPLRSNCPIGTIGIFSGGAKFIFTVAATVGATTVTGNLTGANLADTATSGFSFTDYNYTAYPNCVFDLRNNGNVTIRNININGNIPNLIIGGGWDDDGIQLPGDGILSIDNASITIENYHGYQCPRDGIQIVNTVSTHSVKKPVTILYSICDGNVRQGMSVVGSNQMVVKNCQFINTGKTVNAVKGSNVRSSPAAGIDLEQEAGWIHDSVFENCIIDNNDGAALLSVGDVKNLFWNGGKIIGATNWSIYGSGAGFKFIDTLIVGSPINLSGTGPGDINAPYFSNCTITMDPAYSPTGFVYGNYVMDFGGGGGGYFEHCYIDSYNRGTVYAGDSCVFSNCTFNQIATISPYNGFPFMRSNFYGVNNWIKPGSGVMQENLIDSHFYGPFYINGVEVAGLKPETLKATAAGSFIAITDTESATTLTRFDGTSVQLFKTKTATSVTSSTTPLVAATIPIPTNTVMEIEATYVGIDSTTNLVSRFIYSYLVKNIAGTVTLVDSQLIGGGVTGSFGGSIPAATVSTTNLQLKVQGNTNNIYWKVSYKTTTSLPTL